MKKTIWKLKENKGALSKLNIDGDILAILANRGINSDKKIYEFIKPELSMLEDPHKLFDIDKARDKVIECIEKDKNICIYGDYDVDGITATTILYLGLKELGAKNVTFYIPVRSEGYGLNMDSVKSVKDDGADLMITVDCGITSYKEIEYANSLGLTTIITDHHTLLNPIVPNAYATINPKRYENEYSFSDLAGVGTAFMLLLCIFEKYGKKEEAFKYLDIVSLGTIADIVSLTEANRIIVKKGLAMLNNTKNLGLSMLLEKVFGDVKNKVFKSSDVSFKICPIFNAAGRLKDAKLVVKLLISQNIREIEIIIDELLLKNQKRREIQDEVFEIAKEDVKDRDDLILISSSKDYHHGVIGIVAAKIVDKFNRPAIILEEKPEEKVAVASARSIQNFDITKALKSVADLLVKYGGHKGAAGFTIPIENLQIFRKRINEYAKENMTEDDFVTTIKIDKILTMNKISYEFNKSLELLEPFGFGNPKPKFLTKNVAVTNSKLIGQKKNHLSLDFSKKGYQIKNAVWFFSEEKTEDVFYDIVYTLDENEYKGRIYTKVYIEDMKKSLLKEDNLDYFKSLYATSFPTKSIFYTRVELDVNDNLRYEYRAGYVNIYRRKEFVAKLDENISRVLIQNTSFFNRRFNIFIEKITSIAGSYMVSILIKNDFEFVSFKKEDKNLFNHIKRELIDCRSYNKIEKKALSILFKQDFNLHISTKDIQSDIKLIKSDFINILNTFCMYLKTKYDKEVALITKDMLLLEDSRLRKYTTSNFKEAKYAIIDLDSIDEKLDLTSFSKYIVFDSKNETINNTKKLELELRLPSNVGRLKQKNIEKYGYENVYIKELPNETKQKLFEKLIAGDIILSDRSIIEIL